MNINIYHKLIEKILSVLLLIASYILIGIALFDLHGMKDFPLYLLMLGLLIIVLSFILGMNTVKWCVSLGYLTGSFLGIIFHNTWIDIHGTRMDNIWIWMLSTMLAFVFISIIIDLRKKHSEKHR